jgi:hypothetical protein
MHLCALSGSGSSHGGLGRRRRSHLELQTTQPTKPGAFRNATSLRPFTPNIRLLRSETSFPDVRMRKRIAPTCSSSIDKRLSGRLERPETMLPLVARSHSGCQDGCSFCWLLSPVGLPSAAHCWNWNWRAVFLRHCAVAGHLEGFLWLTLS